MKNKIIQQILEERYEKIQRNEYVSINEGAVWQIVKGIWKKITGGAAKEAAEKAAREAAEAAEAAAKAAKAEKEAIEQAAVRRSAEASREAAEAAAKRKAAEQTAEAAAKKVGTDTAKKTGKEAAESGAKKTAKETGEALAKRAAGAFVAGLLGGQSSGGQRVADIGSTTQTADPRLGMVGLGGKDAVGFKIA